MTSPPPILEHTMADQWFADQQTPEDLEASRRMITLLKGDIGPRLAALATKAAGDGTITKEIHSLRGAIGSIGLAACAQHLHVLEKNWAQLAAADRQQHLRDANECFASGLKKLLGRFPHLGDAK